MNTWTEDDFDRLSWHDNHVHALALRAGEHGAGELILDLDFITEWLDVRGGRFHFLIAPATLTFRGVCDLKASVDYASCAMGPFSIQGIEREQKVYPTGHTTYIWRISIDFPQGELTFLADGFSQVLRAEPREKDEQMLQPNERVPWSGV
jgi:hypothetical protein